jgi:glucose/arabinose dehydrogenase
LDLYTGEQHIHTKSAVNFPNLIGWSGDRKPLAARDFCVTPYADGLDHPRWLYVLANGDVLVAGSRTEPPKSGSEAENLVEGLRQSGQIGKSANSITLLRDADKDGKPDFREVFLSNLKLRFHFSVNNFYSGPSSMKFNFFFLGSDMFSS